MTAELNGTLALLHICAMRIKMYCDGSQGDQYATRTFESKDIVQPHLKSSDFKSGCKHDVLVGE